MALYYNISFFLLLLLMTPNLELSLVKSCFLAPKIQVHIINKLPSNTAQLQVHCASKDDEIANEYLAIDEDLHWSFCESFFETTLYFCHFWWGSMNKSITVFDDAELCVHSALYANYNNNCKWEVRQDGFYLEMYNITDVNNPSFFMYHINYWS
ncbi:S-protein homolog 19-like [Solanum pennellii]|uniref:S-protein homolog n=1 Tax=Solanum pennellii TaxID=28526 RepID=A0ABM1HMG8_SOLPN|nr:S-protein homolog 19-like [Solanum pennellii]